MNRILTLAIVMAMAAGAADAKGACKDAKGEFTKCPPAASAMASPMASAAGAPNCKVGKPCGKSCISKDKVCHK